VIQLLFGDDLVSLWEAVAEVTDKLDQAVAATNVIRFEGGEVNLGELASACRSLPFLGSTRVVVVQRLSEGLARASRQEISAFRETLQSLPPTTELLLLEPSFGKDPATHPLYSLVSKQGKVRRFSLGDGGDAEEWIASKAQSFGLEMSKEACRELWQRVGSDALRLRNEIEKLAVYCLEDGHVAVEQVRALVSPSEESSVFDLVNAIGQKQASRALSILQELMAHQGEPAARLLAMIGQQFRLLLMVKDLMAVGTQLSEIANRMRMPAWLVRRLASQSRFFSQPELEAALEKTLDADVAVKGGSDVAENAIVMELVAQLTL